MPLVPAKFDATQAMSVFRSRRTLYAPVLAMVAFALVACSGKPENSPVIRKKFAELDAMKEEFSIAVAELRAATGEMTVLRGQVSELRAMAPDGTGASAVLARIEAIENRLTALTTTASQQRTVAAGGTGDSSTTAAPASTVAASSGVAPSFGGLATPPAAAPPTGTGDSFRRMTNPAASTPASTTTPTTTTPRPAAPRTETASVTRPTAPAATGTGASTPTSAASRGRYHTIETGDTLEKLAKDNNISVDTLREANRLPAGARPLKGQRLFIPPARQ